MEAALQAVDATYKAEAQALDQDDYETKPQSEIQAVAQAKFKIAFEETFNPAFKPAFKNSFQCALKAKAVSKNYSDFKNAFEADLRAKHKAERVRSVRKAAKLYESAIASCDRLNKLFEDENHFGRTKAQLQQRLGVLLWHLSRPEGDIHFGKAEEYFKTQNENQSEHQTHGLWLDLVSLKCEKGQICEQKRWDAEDAGQSDVAKKHRDEAFDLYVDCVKECRARVQKMHPGKHGNDWRVLLATPKCGSAS